MICEKRLLKLDILNLSRNLSLKTSLGTQYYSIGLTNLWPFDLSIWHLYWSLIVLEGKHWVLSKISVFNQLQMSVVRKWNIWLLRSSCGSARTTNIKHDQKTTAYTSSFIKWKYERSIFKKVYVWIHSYGWITSLWF